MGILKILSVTWLACLTPVSGSLIQKPLYSSLGGESGIRSDRNHRKLHGRFLHITDMHPDPFYKLYSSTEEDHACHSGSGPAGVYGAETSDCDSPLALIDATFKWVEENLKDSIDFVIWTGDSARHDNDEDYPRNTTQVVGQNQLLVDRFLDVFGASKGDRNPGPQPDLLIPIIPSFGNNDILPHNIFEKGPNQWTTTFQEIWRPFIPEEQRHGFSRGGWFYVEVIPNKLAVFSLNTMYFFDKNSAVDGCKSHKQPGYEHFDWLRIQLEFLRQRGMKAILSGHVPPARNDEKNAWDETCWQKYALWLRQYRDVIIGSVYGHMNIEHFILQDFKDIDSKVANGYDVEDEESGFEKFSDVLVQSIEDNDDIKIAVNAPDYLNALRQLWAGLPSAPDDDEQMMDENYKNKPSEQDKYHEKIGGKWAERFGISMVTASVVPNYFSTLRVYEYNITGLEDVTPWHADFVQPPPREWESVIAEDESEDLDDEDPSQAQQSTLFENVPPTSNTHMEELRRRTDERIAPSKKKKKKKKFIVPNPPSSSSPPGPAYSPQPFSWTRYIQYFANNTEINNDLTQTISNETEQTYERRANKTHIHDRQIHAQGWSPGKHVDKSPGKDKDHKTAPLKFEYEVEYDTAEEKDAYGLYKGDGLVMRRWVQLASKIGEFDPSQEELQEEELIPVKEQDLSIDKKKKHKKKKKKKKKKENEDKVRKSWYTFLSRAVTGTLDEDELRDRFGN